MRRLAAVIFHRPWGTSAGELLVSSARQAATRDLISSLRDVDLEPQLVLAPSDGRAQWVEDLNVEVLEATEQAPFHFGRALQKYLLDREIQGLLYFGSGSGYLLDRSLLAALRRFAERDRPGAVLNNFYSCDFAAVASAEFLLDTDLPEIDNPFGFALANGGIPCYALQRSAETQFDIDTPTDVFILRASGRGGPSVRAFLDNLELPHPQLDEILALMTERTAHVCLAGRVNPRTWADIESKVACRTSGLIEGRGMRSQRNPRDPVIQQVIRESGPSAFFERLARAYDGAVIDTRALLADAGRLPEARERFASDLLRTEDIDDPLWLAFTEAAIESPIPVLLGGHSAVSGGLYLLADACWKGRELVRRLHPEPFDPDKEQS
jgi:hypothetical protein